MACLISGQLIYDLSGEIMVLITPVEYIIKYQQ